MFSGMEQVNFMNKLAAGIPESLEDVSRKLSALADIIVDSGFEKCSIVGDGRFLFFILSFVLLVGTAWLNKNVVFLRDWCVIV